MPAGNEAKKACEKVIEATESKINIREPTSNEAKGKMKQNSNGDNGVQNEEQN